MLPVWPGKGWFIIELEGKFRDRLPGPGCEFSKTVSPKLRILECWIHFQVNSDPQFHRNQQCDTTLVLFLGT